MKDTLATIGGKALHEFHITEVTAKNSDLIVEFTPIGGGEPRLYTIYPYWDIDDAFVVIQAIPGEEEKPVRWAIPAEFRDRIEIMPEGFP